MTPASERKGMKEVGTGTHFDAEVTPADVIFEEEVTGCRGMTTNLEQAHEIILRYGN